MSLDSQNICLHSYIESWGIIYIFSRHYLTIQDIRKWNSCILLIAFPNRKKNRNGNAIECRNFATLGPLTW